MQSQCIHLIQSILTSSTFTNRLNCTNVHLVLRYILCAYLSHAPNYMCKIWIDYCIRFGLRWPFSVYPLHTHAHITLLSELIRKTDSPILQHVTKHTRSRIVYTIFSAWYVNAGPSSGIGHIHPEFNYEPCTNVRTTENYNFRFLKRLKKIKLDSMCPGDVVTRMRTRSAARGRNGKKEIMWYKISNIKCARQRCFHFLNLTFIPQTIE